MIEASGVFKSAQQDVFDQGCIGATFDNHIDWTFEGATVDEVIDMFCTFCSAPAEDRELSIARDSCDEVGRVDVTVMETEQGDPLTEAETELWKAGQFKAFYCVYSINLQEVNRKPISAVT